MGRTERPEIVTFDVEPVVEAALDAVDGPLYSLVEFDLESWNDLYVAEETLETYDSEEQMREHFDRIHGYVNLDFTEIDLFTEDLLPIADEIRYKTTAMDVMKFVRIYLAERTGLFVALDPGERVEPLVVAVEDAADR